MFGLRRRDKVRPRTSETIWSIFARCPLCRARGVRVRVCVVWCGAWCPPSRTPPLPDLRTPTRHRGSVQFARAAILFRGWTTVCARPAHTHAPHSRHVCRRRRRRRRDRARGWGRGRPSAPAPAQRLSAEDCAARDGAACRRVRNNIRIVARKFHAFLRLADIEN